MKARTNMKHDRRFLLRLENTVLDGPVFQYYDLDRFTDLYPDGYDPVLKTDEDGEPVDNIPLKLLQAMVHGHIESMNLNFFGLTPIGVISWIDEEGKLNEDEWTMPLYSPYTLDLVDTLVGSIVFTGEQGPCCTALTLRDCQEIERRIRSYWRRTWPKMNEVCRTEMEPKTALWFHGEQVTL